ncbi:EamA family transporter [Sphingobacterium sp. KU25419]|nr:EamA family transporter [Sphingobacterium sp. KU25419]
MGVNFFFIEKALHSFPPFILGSFRFITASVLLMGYCVLKGYKIFNKRAIRDSIVVGFLLLFIDMGGLIWAEQYVSVVLQQLLLRQRQFGLLYLINQSGKKILAVNRPLQD